MLGANWLRVRLGEHERLAERNQEPRIDSGLDQFSPSVRRFASGVSSANRLAHPPVLARGRIRLCFGCKGGLNSFAGRENPVGPLGDEFAT